MPELPEVEVVRRGLEAHVLDQRIDSVEVLHQRPVRRHLAGADDFALQLTGRHFTAARRRGKYLWLPLAERSPSGVEGSPSGVEGRRSPGEVEGSPSEVEGRSRGLPERSRGTASAGDALLAHLGMSGQLLVQPHDAEPERHLRVRFRLKSGLDLRFVDQRMFGGLSLSPGGADLPSEIAHIARDPLDPAFDDEEFVQRVRRSDSAIKRQLLNQALVSGIGNIYADEALWRAQVHGERPASRLSRAHVLAVLEAVRGVMAAALEQGGTSFDALYVNVNGESGYFDRSLHAYGQEDRPCERCGTPIRRTAFMNRSSFWCPVCQPAPRSARSAPSNRSQRSS